MARKVTVIHHGPMVMPHPHYRYNNWISLKKKEDSDESKPASSQQWHSGTTVTTHTQHQEVEV